MATRFSMALCGIWLGLGTFPAGAAVVFQHSGSTDPAAEGWSVTGPGPGTSAGPVTNDLGLGINAWNITDASSASGSILHYNQVPSGALVSQAASQGWRLSANVRVLNPLDTPDSSSVVQYSDGATTFSMDFGSDADGDPIVVLRTGFDGTMTLGPAYTLDSAGSTYHQFDLIYDPVALSADLFVDGVERISNYGGQSSPGLTRVLWGAGGSVTQGNTNHQSLEWAVVPEPAVLPLLAIGACALPRRRRRVALTTHRSSRTGRRRACSPEAKSAA